MRRQVRSGIAAAAWLLGLLLAGVAAAEADTPPPAAADPAVAAMKPCSEGADPAARAVACTHLIEGGALKGKELGAAYLFRGEAQAERNELKAAVDDFSQALKNDPDATDALYARAGAYMLLQRLDLALSDLGQLLKLAPGDPDTLSRRADIYFLQGKYQAALDDLDAVLKKVPDDFQSRLQRAGLLIQLARYQDAIADCTLLIKQNPEAPSALYNRGRAAYLKGDYAAAAKDFEAAMQQRDDNPYAALRLTLARAHQGKPDPDALDRAAKAFAADRWPLPIVAFYQGKIDEAALMAATKLGDPARSATLAAEAEYYLGEWALLKNDKAAARRHFTAAAGGKADRADLEFIDAGLALKKLGS